MLRFSGDLDFDETVDLRMYAQFPKSIGWWFFSLELNSLTCEIIIPKSSRGDFMVVMV